MVAFSQGLAAPCGSCGTGGAPCSLNDAKDEGHIISDLGLCTLALIAASAQWSRRQPRTSSWTTNPTHLGGVPDLSMIACSLTMPSSCASLVPDVSSLA